MWRNVAVECLEGLLHEGIDCGRVGDVGGKGTIDDSDEHRVAIR